MKKIESLLCLVLLVLTLSSCAQGTKTPVSERKLSAGELAKFSQATFAAGCFWHEEALFQSIKGVKEAVSGYAGGTTQQPTYEGIEEGNTGHAETVNVYYDSSVVSYPQLLKIYFSGQDPTQVNGQGPDHGTQYRSILFYRNDAEKKMAEDYITSMKVSGKYKAPISVQLMPFTKFWKAEDYHQDYIDKHPYGGYVMGFSIPEVRKVQKQFPDMIKPERLF
jgi:peptide-methionine (S)-S-oxide reductase